jgi:polygalacturonase
VQLQPHHHHHHDIVAVAMRFTLTTTTAALFAPLVAAVPGGTRTVERAASCSVTSYSGVAAAVESCKAITLSNIAVPAGSSIDLSKLQKGATVTFAGKTVGGALFVL